MMIRHGDLLLVPTNTDRLALGATTQPRDEHNRLILLEGEATGHAHTILDADAHILVTKQGADELRLLVLGEPAALVHEEHATILVPPGTYRIVRKREYISATEQAWVTD